MEKTTVPTRLYLTPRQKRVLEATARRDGVTVSALLREVVQEWIDDSDEVDEDDG